jgi:hypothetical protein
LDRDQFVGYLGHDNRLLDGRGRVIGNYEITKTWDAMSEVKMHQVYATVNGVTFTGKAQASSKVFRGERLKGQPKH